MSTYAIQQVEKDSITEIHFSGSLIINHIAKIYEDLKGIVTKDKQYSLFIDNPESLDITFVELVISLKKSFKELKVTSTLKDDILQLLTKNGLDKELNN